MKKFPFKALSAVAALEFLRAPGFSQLEQDEMEKFDSGLGICKDQRRPTLVVRETPMAEAGRAARKFKVADAD